MLHASYIILLVTTRSQCAFVPITTLVCVQYRYNCNNNVNICLLFSVNHTAYNDEKLPRYIVNTIYSSKLFSRKPVPRTTCGPRRPVSFSGVTLRTVVRQCNLLYNLVYGGAQSFFGELANFFY